MTEWAEKFRQKLKDKELASLETKKSFQIYQEAALKLFDNIEKKIKEIGVISSVRQMVGEVAVSSIKALKLKCQDKYLELIPEGINLDESKGRIRIKHNCKLLSQFVYLHLTLDAQSTATYPENLMWVLNEKGTERLEGLPPFNDEMLEHLIEVVFLES